MKYRVITDGFHYRILTKRLFGWSVVSRVAGCMEYQWREPIDFKTEQECVDYMNREYGLSAKRIRTWRDI